MYTKHTSLSLALLAGSLASPTVLADAPPEAPIGIRITSFVRLQQTAILSELCGIVTGLPPGATPLVRVTMDPATNRPGHYQTLPGPDGRFCLLGFSYTGYAQAEVYQGAVRLAQSTKALLIEKPSELPATLDETPNVNNR